MPVNLRICAAFCAICGAFGCGSKARDCPNVPDVSDCSAQTSSYDSGIAEIFESRCLSCHVAGGEEASIPLTNYAQIYGERMSIAGQLLSCDMPPEGSPALTADERTQILDWLSCGGPE